MRAKLLTVGLCAGLPLAITPARAQQRPTAEGAWEACTVQVLKKLGQLPGLSFPEYGTAGAEVRTTGSRMRPSYLIRAVATRSEDGRAAEHIPFSCLVGYRMNSFDRDGGYVFKRVLVPDSTVAVPGRTGRPMR